VLVSIVSLAVKEIDGVTELSGKGVRLDIIDKKINIDVFLEVSSKVACNTLAFNVQENIKKALESMTNFKTGVINVNILGVSFEEEKEVEL